MLKYLEKKLNKTNVEIQEFTLEKKKLEDKIIELDRIIDCLEVCMQIEEKNKPYKTVVALSIAFVLGTIPFMSLAYCILPVILICDITFGALGIGNLVSLFKNNIKKSKIKKFLGDREISTEEKYRVQRDIDESDKLLSGFSVILMMKERDASELKSIIQSDDWLEELKKYSFLLKEALNYEFDEYLRKLSEMPISNVHLNELGRVRKLERK